MRARLVALLVTAVVGATGGVTTALVGTPGTEGSASSSPRPTAFEDPLGLGVPLQNLGCTGEDVLVVATGDGSPALHSAVLNNGDDAVKYLETDESCDTRWNTDDSTAEAPEYVAYIGPEPASSTELCEKRMSLDHKGDNVTRLGSGNTMRVQCLCHVALDRAPRLEPEMDVDPETGIWIRAMQSMFAVIDGRRGDRSDPAHLDEDDVTGIYTPETVARVESLQEYHNMPVDGVTDLVVWRQLTGTGCRLYDY